MGDIILCLSLKINFDTIVSNEFRSNLHDPKEFEKQFLRYYLAAEALTNLILRGQCRTKVVQTKVRRRYINIVDIYSE